MAEQEQNEIKTRHLELQSKRSLTENLADLPIGCDWGGKRNSKGKAEYWRGYKLYLSLVDGGVALTAVLTSASPHDSQVAIPLMQMTAKRATVLYDLADSAYDAPETHQVSKAPGLVPIIGEQPYPAVSLLWQRHRYGVLVNILDKESTSILPSLRK